MNLSSPRPVLGTVHAVAPRRLESASRGAVPTRFSKRSADSSRSGREVAEGLCGKDEIGSASRPRYRLTPVPTGHTDPRMGEFWTGVRPPDMAADQIILAVDPAVSTATRRTAAAVVLGSRKRSEFDLPWGRSASLRAGGGWAAHRGALTPPARSGDLPLGEEAAPLTLAPALRGGWRRFAASTSDLPP